MTALQLTRRDMLQSTAIATGTLVSMHAFPTDGLADRPRTVLKRGDVVLFQGDSITDARRDRKTQSTANSLPALGKGYPLVIGKGLLVDHQDLDLQIYNRGISGNKVPDLQRRWQKDCLDLKPAVLSILIGVNDIWHKLNGRYDGTVESYQAGLASLIKQTKEALPSTTIVICEPFVLRCGAVKDSWFPEFDQRRAAAKEVAQSANTLWVPFQTMFDDAVASGTKPEYWARDGVHPTAEGHALMAKTWRKVVRI